VNVEELVNQYFVDNPAIVAVLLFGSRSAGRHTAESDVDLAILYQHGKAPKGEAVIQFKQSLCDALGQEVDLVVLNDANTIISSQIYKQHTVLYCSDKRLLTAFFTRLITDYADLKELRKPMEADILKRRSHG